MIRLMIKQYFCFIFLESSEINCYVHCVTPIKKSGSSTYFNCSLQTESSVIKSVCFSPEKRETLDTLAKQKSPVKIKKFSINKRYGRDDVVISKHTTITPSTITFDYVSQDDMITINSLRQVAPEQLVCIKGNIVQLSSTKTVVLQSVNVKKQEGYIADPTGYMKVIFWGRHADSIDEGSTYTFNKLRVKVSQNQMYLNTPKQEDECVITSAEPFIEPLPTVEEQSTTKEVIASILGVFSVSKYKSCRKCSKKVTVKEDISFCDNCKLSQKTSKCTTQQTLRIFVETTSRPVENHRLILYNDVAAKLFGLCNLQDEPTDDEITRSILELDDVKIIYDTQSNKLIDIELIDI